jgi:hypothetical protein
MVIASCMNGPDLELHFIREVSSPLSTQWIDRNLASPLRWPGWFFSLREAKILDQAPLQAGSTLEFFIDPKKVKWKQFQIRLKVINYIPGRLLKLTILEDSSQRLTQLFSHLDWTIELIPQGQGTLIRGSATAKTHHWRSRLFGRLAQRILMNQVFYPDLIKLAQLKQPFSVEPKLAPPGSGF